MTLINSRSKALTLALSACLLATQSVALGDELSESSYQKRNNANYDDSVLAYLRGKTDKIVNGKPAALGAYPWQVSLQVAWIADPKQAHFCGGSIYNERWIVTAAHCLVNLKAQDVNVAAGTVLLRQGILRFNVLNMIINKKYDESTDDNDIALVQLMSPLSLSASIQSIPLLKPDEEETTLVEGRKLTVTGWGARQEGGDVVRELNYVVVPFQPRSKCNSPSSYNGKITENMICAGLPVGGKDACQGDSGGPLVSGQGGSASLVGVVSWGNGCAEAGAYGVYTRVARFREWVSKCTSDSASC